MHLGGIPKRKKPWCWVQGNRNRNWEYCDIPMCDTPAPLRKCNIEGVFQNSSLYSNYNFTLDGNSCKMKDQGHIDNTRVNVDISPWEDCGYTYKDKVGNGDFFKNKYALKYFVIILN